MYPSTSIHRFTLYDSLTRVDGKYLHLAIVQELIIRELCFCLSYISLDIYLHFNPFCVSQLREVIILAEHDGVRGKQPMLELALFLFFLSLFFFSGMNRHLPRPLSYM